jgi:macrodomain Ter protein organizer (MatP/YcbG family)
MLQIDVQLTTEGWDETRQEFVEPEVFTLKLEHSLVSLSKWESKWHKAFLTKTEKTEEEILDYIKCMTLNENVDPTVYQCLSNYDFMKINEYIENPMTATVITEEKGSKNNRETVTSELIYYWIIALNIDFECQYWHLNRLLTLIRVCNIKNTPPKKMSKGDIMRRNSALNEARRKQLNTKG